MKAFAVILNSHTQFEILMSAETLVDACQLLGNVIADPKMVVSIKELHNYKPGTHSDLNYAEVTDKKCCGNGCCGKEKKWKRTESLVHAHEWNLVNSSFIHMFAWAETKHGYGYLTIAMLDGTEYTYKDVHYNVIDQFWISPSKGAFYAKNIRGKFSEV